MLVSLEGMGKDSHFCVAGKETPDLILERKEKIALVRAGIALLDGRDRQILQMTMAGLTVRKIADMLGISFGLVSRRRNQIYAELRKYFREYGIERA